MGGHSLLHAIHSLRPSYPEGGSGTYDGLSVMIGTHWPWGAYSLQCPGSVYSCIWIIFCARTVLISHSPIYCERARGMNGERHRRLTERRRRDTFCGLKCCPQMVCTVGQKKKKKKKKKNTLRLNPCLKKKKKKK